MITQPNVWADVLRGTTTGDEHGDPIDRDRVVVARVPMKLTVRALTTSKPSSNQQRTSAAWTGRCAPHLDVRVGDRLRVDGQPLLSVIARHVTPGAAGQGDARLELQAARS